MPSLGLWRSDGEDLAQSAASRAQDAWRRIQRRPTSITLLRESGSSKATLAAQTVRIEANNGARWDTALNAMRAVQQVVVFGVRNHPTVTDTDIRRSDRFNLNGTNYQVITIMTPPGEVQAVCEASGAS